jgi:hypothetical protein
VIRIERSSTRHENGGAGPSAVAPVQATGGPPVVSTADYQATAIAGARKRFRKRAAQASWSMLMTIPRSAATDPLRRASSEGAASTRSQARASADEPPPPLLLPHDADGRSR